MTKLILLEASFKHKNLLKIIGTTVKYHNNHQTITGFFNATPLHYAVKNGHLEISQMILKNVEKIDPKDYCGTTPLHYAAENGFLELCKSILDKVEEKNPENDFGDTPIDYANVNGHKEVVALINSYLF